jgi:tetratricopeptide (TPR) repeat protein
MSHQEEATSMRFFSLTALALLLSPIFFTQATLQTEEKIEEFIKQENYKEAITLLLKECKTEDVLKLCQTYTQSGQFFKANAVLKQLLLKIKNEFQEAEYESDELKIISCIEQINYIHYMSGENNRVQGKYEEALQFYNKITENDINYYLAQAHCYVGLFLNTNEKEYEENALKNYTTYLSMYDEFDEETKKQENIKKTYGYYLWGVSQLDLKNNQYSKALVNHKMAVHDCFDKDPQGKAYMDFIEIEGCFKIGGLDEESLTLLNTCIEQFSKTNNLEGLITAYFLKSKINHEKAKDAYDQAMELVKKYGFEQFSRFYKNNESY